MRKSPSKKMNATSAFAKLKTKYRLSSPGQIKQRILWHHVMQLIRFHFRDPDDLRKLDEYDRVWKACETEEMKRA